MTNAVFKIIDKNGECFSYIESSISFDVKNSNKLETKKDIYEFLKSKVFMIDDNQTIEDLTKDELEQYKKENHV